MPCLLTETTERADLVELSRRHDLVRFGINQRPLAVVLRWSRSALIRRARDQRETHVEAERSVARLLHLDPAAALRCSKISFLTGRG